MFAKLINFMKPLPDAPRITDEQLIIKVGVSACFLVCILDTSSFISAAKIFPSWLRL